MKKSKSEVAEDIKGILEDDDEEEDFDEEDEEEEEEEDIKEEKKIQPNESKSVKKNVSDKITKVEIPTQTIQGLRFPDGSVKTDLTDILLWICQKLTNIEEAVG